MISDDEDHSTPSELLAIGISNASYRVERDSFRVAANRLLGPYASYTVPTEFNQHGGKSYRPCVSVIRQGGLFMNLMPFELWDAVG